MDDRKHLRDLIADIVARGHGVVTIGRGRIVCYGVYNPDRKYPPGVAFIDNDIHIHMEEAEALLYEACTMSYPTGKDVRGKQIHTEAAEVVYE